MSFKLTSSALFLIAANIVPIIGVFHFGWDAIAILVLYWLESVIIGLINIPKILACRKTEAGSIVAALSNLFLTGFFIVHFGMFTGVHGSFLYQMFGAKETMDGLLTGGPILWTAFTFLFSHIFSMLVNFFGKKEYLGRDPGVQMFQPYGRVFVMHFVVIFGGFLIQALGSPLYAVILLICLKTGIDLIVHNKEHFKKIEVTT